MLTQLLQHVRRVGQNHIHMVWCVYGILDKYFTDYAVMYGVHIRFCPTLHEHDLTRFL